MKVNNFTENSIYLDTNFIYCFVRPIPEYKQEILYFFSKIEEGKIHAYTCVDTFDELAYRLLLAFIKDKYKSNPIDLLRKHTQNMMEEFYPKVIIDKRQAIHALHSIMDKVQSQTIGIDPEIIEQEVEETIQEIRKQKHA